MIDEIYELKSFHKTSSTIEGCPFFINMLNILFIDNMRLFLNILLHVHVGIFSNPFREISSVGSICYVIDSDTMIKFVDLTHLIKPILNSIKF